MRLRRCLFRSTALGLALCAQLLRSLFLVGAPALPAVPALVAALDDPVPEVRSGAGFVLGELGRALGRSGGAPWWVVPRVYAKELGGLAALLVVWFAIAARVPRRRPASGLAQTALFTLTASVPAALAAGATHHAVTREWARGFLLSPC